MRFNEKWITTIYTNKTSSESVNGFAKLLIESSSSIYLPYLCRNVINIYQKLSRNERENRISDVPFRGCHVIYIDSTELCLKKVSGTLDEYASFSGLNINTSKTQVIWIGSQTERRTQTEFTILGITFTHNLADMGGRNYKDNEKISKIQMKLWSARNITLFGRIRVLKSLIFPNLITYFQRYQTWKIINIRIWKTMF